MGKRGVVETRDDRRALVADAGWSSLSVGSLLAGVLVAYGLFAILTGVAAGVLQATGAGTDITERWGDLGVPAGLVVAGLLLLSYLFGGYVAGRMARRAGLLHGVGVFVLGVVVVGAVAVIVRQAAGTEAVVDRLRDLGLPTTGKEWGRVGTVAGLASLAAVLVGSLAGGALGERWHARLLARAIDPDVGAEAVARREAERAAAEAQGRHTGSQQRVDTATLRGLRTDEVETVTAPAATTAEEPAERPVPTTREEDAVARRRAELAADRRARADAEDRAADLEAGPDLPEPVVATSTDAGTQAANDRAANDRVAANDRAADAEAPPGPGGRPPFRSSYRR